MNNKTENGMPISTENLSNYKAVAKTIPSTGDVYYIGVYFPRKGRKGFDVKCENGFTIPFVTKTMAIQMARQEWEKSQGLIAAGEFTGSDGR